VKHVEIVLRKEVVEMKESDEGYIANICEDVTVKPLCTTNVC
jgi:hypothetical protein